MTELREYGDNKTIVIYTNEGKVASVLKRRKACFKTVDYIQGQYSKKKLRLIGLDLYFPKREKERLLKVCARLGEQVSQI